MAVIYPQVDQASNPPITITSQKMVGTTGDGTEFTRAGLESFFDAAREQGGIGGTLLSMPSVQQKFTDQIFGEGSELVEYNPSPRVPITPPPSYEPGMDPMFNYFEGQKAPDAVLMEGGGLVGEAKRVQQQGRNGDSMLVHMNPDEFNAMTAIGGLGGLVENGATINPETGLPEMFNFKDILPTVLGVAGAAFGLPTWAVALGTGATTAITTGDIGKGILAGLGSYALGSLFEGVGASGVADPSVAAGAAPSSVTGAGASTGQIGMNTATAPSVIGPSVDVGAGMLVPSSGLPSSIGNFDVGGAAARSFDGALGGDFSGPSFQTPIADSIASGASNARINVGAGFNAGPTSGPINYTGGGNFISSQNFPAANLQADVAAIDAANQAAGGMVNATDAARNAKFLSTYKDAAFGNAPLSTAFDSAATGPSKLELFGEGISQIGQPGGVSYLDAATKGLGGLGSTAAGAGLFDEEPYDYAGFSGSRRRYNTEPMAPLSRTRLTPGADYRPGFDPAFSYFAQDGKRGELDPSMGGVMSNPARNAVMQSAQEIASNATPQPQMMAPRPAMYSPNAAARAVLPMTRMANGGVPEEQVMAGLMDVASEEVKNNLDERMSVPAQDSEPQSPEERIVYDNAMLAVQGVLEDEAAQDAVSEFIETFGFDAYQALVDAVNTPREEGGVIKPADGQSSVKDGAIQGEDVIAGMIVDPETGEESANLRIGENEYVEPAESLTRRAMAAGLPPTPKNGAMVRSAEEDQLRMAYG